MKKVLIVLIICLAAVAGLIFYSSRTRPMVSRGESQSQAEVSIDESSQEELIQSSSTSTPTGTVVLFMECLRSFDVEGMDSYTTNPTAGTMENSDDPILEVVRMVTQRVRYQIESEDIHGDQAVVKLTVTTVDVSGFMSQLIGEATKYAMAQTLRGQPIDLENHLRDYMAENLDVDSLGEIHSDTQVVLALGADDRWLIKNKDGENTPFINALTGGVLDTVQKYADLADQYLR